MQLLGVARPYANFNAGQVVQTVKGDRYVVLDSDMHNRILLYFDEKNPEKQQVIHSFKQNQKEFNNFKLIPVCDLKESESVEAAKNSVLMEPAVIEKLISVAAESEQNGVGKMSHITARSIASSVCNSFKRMIETLKMEYIELLSSNGLLDKLISYMVLVAGQSSLPFDKELRDTNFVQTLIAAKLDRVHSQIQSDSSVLFY